MFRIFALLGILIVIVTLGVYGPSLANDFVSYDDDILIYNNPLSQNLNLTSIKIAFTSYDPELYIPLTFLSYQIDHTLFGLNPFFFHLTSLFLHIGSALLVMWFVFLLTRRLWIAFFCGLLFAVHPINTEAVVWAAARKDVLSTFFFLGSLVLYLLYQEKEEKKYYRASIGVFLLGLLSKVSIIMLPVVLLLIDDSEKRRLDWASMKEKAPFFVLSLIFGVIALFGKSDAIAALTLWERILLWCKSVTFSLSKILLPSGLSVMYPQVDPITIFSPKFFVSFVVIILLAVLIPLLRRRARFAYFGLTFFLLTFLPTITSFAKRDTLFFASDRYASVPAIGIFFIALIWLFSLIGKRRLGKRAFAAIVCSGCTVLAIATHVQAQVWRNSEALYTHVLAHYPDATWAHNNLGIIYFEREAFDDALEQFERALALHPESVDALVNIGQLYLRIGKQKNAQDAFERAVKVIPENPSHITKAHLEVYYRLGAFYERQGDTEKAIAQFEEAAQKGERHAKAQYNLGVMYQKYYRNAEAMEAYRRATELDVRYTEAHYNLAALYAESGRLEEAVEHLNTVILLNPDHEDARRHLRNIKRLMPTNSRN